MEANTKLKITVDHNKCVGSTICISLAPKVFSLNKEGQSIVIDAEGETLKNILNAADNCPLSAIKIFDENGKCLFPPD